jgi:hypothetical protein
MVHHLVKTRGYTLQGAKQMLKNNAQGVRDNMEIIDLLQDVKSFLTELKQQLDAC